LGQRPGAPPSALHRHAAAQERRREGLVCVLCRLLSPRTRRPMKEPSPPAAMCGGRPARCVSRAGLTLRSTGPATASAVSLVRGTWCIIAYQAYGACLRGPVNSNVRQHTKTTGTHRALRAIRQRHALRTPSKDDARSKVPSPNRNATSFRFSFRFACLGSTTRSTGHKCQASVQDLLASAETTRSTPQNQVVCTDAFECHRSGRRWPRMV